MKRIIQLLIAAAITVTCVSAQLRDSADARRADAKVLTTVIKVPTIVCSSCVATVTKALTPVNGVTTAKVDLKKKTATVKYVSAKVTVEKLERAIADAGYDANNVKRNPEAYEKLDACCKTDEKK